jgi:hypothetical protein
MQSGFAQEPPEISQKPTSIDVNLEYGSFGVVIVRNDTITVGTDSRVYARGEFADTACKVTEINGVIIATVGLLFSHTGFVFLDNAKNILGSTGSFDYRLHSYESFVVNEMTSLFDNATSWHDFVVSDSFRQINNVHTVFCTFVNGTADIFEGIFVPRCTPARVVIDTVFRHYAIPSGQFGNLLFGTRDVRIDSLQQAMRSIMVLPSVAPEDIVSIIITQISRWYPQFVGGDIDMVQLTADGKVSWIHSKPKCN